MSVLPSVRRVEAAEDGIERVCLFEELHLFLEKCKHAGPSRTPIGGLLSDKLPETVSDVSNARRQLLMFVEKGVLCCTASVALQERLAGGSGSAFG